ncbi:MAG: hypothetical protein OXT65_09815 [Alphaproteobacteria bacterium]|nr:hypothetical protein [Alphaproteobacteria bacterium]
MAKKITSRDIKVKIVEAFGGKETDWKRTGKKKNTSGQWQRTFENKNTGQDVIVTEGKNGLEIITPGLTETANAGFKNTKTPSAAEMTDFANNFHDEIAQELDFIMLEAEENGALNRISRYLATRHMDTGYDAAAFAQISVDINEIVTEEDSYSTNDVAKKFTEIGFKVEDGKIFYENSFPFTDEQPAQGITAEQAFQEDLQSYIQHSFIYDIMNSKSFDRFYGTLLEYNSDNAYNCSFDFKPREIEISDLTGTMIEDLLAATRCTGLEYTADDLTQKLETLGFTVESGTLTGHDPAREATNRPTSIKKIPPPQV